MKFQLYKYYKEAERIQERDLSLFRLWGYWLFDFNFYRGVFKSYGLDVQFNLMYPLNELLTVRLCCGIYSFSIGLLQRDFDMDSWDDLTYGLDS